jgi:hypothetical protein
LRGQVRLSLADSLAMADVMSQLLPVGAALAGVALTFAGNAWLERQKWRRTRSDGRQDRTLQAFADLLQSTTDIARTLRQLEDRVTAGVSIDLDLTSDRVDELIGEARRYATVARLVGPTAAFPAIDEIEQNLAPLHQLVKDITAPGDGQTLRPPARKLMQLGQLLLQSLRSAGHVDSPL